jgi:hypothetical protein
MSIAYTNTLNSHEYFLNDEELEINWHWPGPETLLALTHYCQSMF